MNGSDLIEFERERQLMNAETSMSHDDGHTRGELIDASLSYIFAAINPGHPAMKCPPKEWPFGKEWWKPSDEPIRNLVKAGALIAAEIDRLQRIKACNA